MSKFLVYLKVKPFVRQWLTFHFGNPVSFPAQSAENACLRRFLSRLPSGKNPDMQAEDEVAVCLPDSKQKPLITYNYLSPSAKAAVVECIEDTFRLQMWKELNGVENCGCSILTGVRAWCEGNGISLDYDYTLKMRYQRMRNAYLKNGVDLRCRTRIKDSAEKY